MTDYEKFRRCEYRGHDYPRPLFRAVMQEPAPLRVPGRSAPPTDEPIQAYADQECRGCGYRRVLAYSGRVVREGFDILPFGADPGDGQAPK